MTYAHPERRQTARKRKQELIDAKGGKCERCGGEFPLEVYDFHHRNTNTKQFNINQNTLTYKPLADLYEEAKQCSLLCSNCHRLVHANEEEDWFDDPSCRHRNGRPNKRSDEDALLGDSQLELPL